MSVSSSLPTSVATASKTSVDGASRATSVATRRSAACSSATRGARRVYASCLSRFGIRNGRSDQSVEPWRRASVSGQSSPVERTGIAPHNRLWTRLGSLTDETMPTRSAVSAAGRPRTTSRRVHRAELPVGRPREKPSPLRTPSASRPGYRCPRDTDGDDSESVLFEPQNEPAGAEDERDLVAHSRRSRAAVRLPQRASRSRRSAAAPLRVARSSRVIRSRRASSA